MARALIVGCGCRGRTLAIELLDRGWLVRGTTRRAAGLGAIEACGAEAALADPADLVSVLAHAADVALLYWLMGSAHGDAAALADLHGARLERLLAELVDTPLRGFVYEAAGTAGGDSLEGGSGAVRGAAERWRIPAWVVDEQPEDVSAWTAAMLAPAAAIGG